MAPPPTPPSPPGGQNPPDLSAQIEATKQLTAAMAALLQQLGRTNQGLRDQSDISSDLSDMLDEISEQRDKEEKQARERQEQLEKEIKSIKSVSDLTSLLSKKMKEAAEKSKSMATAMAAIGGAAKGFKAGISLMNGALSGLGSILSTIAGAIFDLGIAILTGPIKMFNALFAKAKAAMNGSTELATALEKVRENFGDIGSGLGGTVASMGSQLSTGLIAPGLSAMRVFGGIAEATNYANEMASASPAAFQKLSAQFQDSALEALAMAKGLGISKEEFAGLMNVAVSSGRDIVEIETEMTKFAKGMANEFKLNSKMISRDMGRAMKDVKHFANLTVKELAKAATYAQGLGLELKDITGTLDAFNTFESAAENVSKLSQAFGVNLDTMKLLEAESPDEQIAHVKQAFEAAGKSADQMNRRELQLLAQTLNMDEAMVRQALSTKNAGISMDKVKASSAGLEGQSMSTAEAMKALSKDIERVVKSGEPPKGDNFLDVFLEGVMEGMERTSEFRHLMMNMMRSIHAVRQAGRELGAQLMEVVPGLKDIIKGLAELVSPDKLGGMFRAFSKSFIEFFQTLKSGGVASVKDLVENLKKNFLDYLTASGSGGQSFLKGLKDMWEAAKKIIVSAIDYLGEILESGINLLTDVLTGKFDAQASAIAGGIMGEFAPILDAFKRLFERLKEPALNLLKLAFNFIVDAVGSFLKDHWGKLLAAYLAPAIIGGFTQGFSAAVGTTIMSSVVTPFLQKLAAQILGASATAQITERAAGPIGDATRGVGEQSGAPFKQAAATLGKMAIFIAAALLFVGATIALVRYFDVKMEEVKIATVIVAAAAGLAVAGAAASALVASAGQSANASAPAATAALPVLEVVLVGMLGFATFILIAAEASKGVTQESINKVLIVMAAVSGLILAAAAISLAAAGIGTLITGSYGIGGVAIAVGLIAMAAVVVAMIDTARSIVAMADTIQDVTKVKAMTKVLIAVGDLYIKTIPIIGATFAAVGLVAIGPLAAAAFNKITDIVDKIVDTTINIINTIQGLNIADAAVLKSKVEPFISVMKSVIDMIKGIGDVLQSAGGGMISGIISSITGDSPFDGAAELITSLVGGGSSGLIGVLNVIQKSLTQLKGVPIETISAFANTLSAVAGMIANIGSMISGFKSKGSYKALFGLIDVSAEHAFNAAENIVAMKQFIGVLLPSASSLIESIKDSVTGLKPEEAQAVGNMAQGLGSVLSAVGTLFSSLVDSIGNFRKKSSFKEGEVKAGSASAAAVASEIESFDASAFSDFIVAFSTNVTPILDDIRFFIDDIMTSVMSNLQNVSPSQIEAMKPVFEILASVFSMVTTMYTSLGDIDLGNIGGALSFATNNIVLKIPSAADMLMGLAAALPMLFAALGPAINTFNLAPGSEKRIGAMKDAMSAVSAVFKAVNETLPDMQDAAGQKMLPMQVAWALQDKITALALFLFTISASGTDPDTGQKTLAPLELLTRELNRIPEGPKAESIQRLKTYADSLNNLSSVAKALQDAENIISNMPTLSKGEIGPPTAEQAAAQGSSIADQVASLRGLIVSLSDKETGIPSLESVLSEANKNVSGTGATNLTQLMNKLSGYTSVKDLPSTVDSIAKALPKEAADASISQLDKALADFEKNLNSMVGTRPVDIKAKLKSTLGKLGIEGAKYVVDAKPIALTVNLNVTMSAGDVAAGIASAPTIIRSRIEQLATRAGVQGYDISQSIPTPAT